MPLRNQLGPLGVVVTLIVAIALIGCWAWLLTGPVSAQSNNSDNIILIMTKISDFSYELDWADLDGNPVPYKIYRSEDPTILGKKIATVRGTTYTDVITGNPTIPQVYYYKVKRVTG